MALAQQDVHVHNKFVATLTDVATLEVRQVAYAENVCNANYIVSNINACGGNKYQLIDCPYTDTNVEATRGPISAQNNRYTKYITGSARGTVVTTPTRPSSPTVVTWASLIALGSGTGTPAATDTALFQPLWVFDSTYVECLPGIPTGTLHYSIDVPATTAYVASITEIGFSCGNAASTGVARKLATHALFTDAEGNPIVIQKTDMQILHIDAYVYFTTEYPALSNQVGAPIIYSSRLETDANFFANCNTVASEIWLNTRRVNKVGYTPGSNMAPGKQAVLGVPIVMNPVGVGTTYEYLPETCKAGTDGNFRWELAQNNYGFFRSIYVEGVGSIALPNTNVFPEVRWEALAVGTGDGIATNFYTRLNECKADTETVYVDGVAVVRDVDYTFKAYDITKSPIYNKLYSIYAERNATPSDGGSYVFDDKAYGTTGAALACDIGCPITFIHTTATAPLSYAMFGVPQIPTCNVHYTAEYISANTGYTGIRAWSVYYDEEGMTVDHIHLGVMLCDSNVRSILISYSDDGETWTTAYTATFTCLIADATTHLCTAADATDTSTTVYFDAPITAKYWRITPELSNLIRAPFSVYSAWNLAEAYKRSLPGYELAITLGNTAVFDYGDIGINFTNAPAAGAVITMDCTLDLPYKDADCVFSGNMTSQLSLTTGA